MTIIDLGHDPSGPTFRLFQPPARVPAAPVPEEDNAVDDGTVNAGPLIRRLIAIKDALEDIPRQAKRLARWRATARRRAPSATLSHHCAPAGRRDSASGQSMKSMRS